MPDPKANQNLRELAVSSARKPAELSTLSAREGVEAGDVVEMAAGDRL